MIIHPKVRGFICTNAHPAGCEANVKEQIDFVQQQSKGKSGPKKVLVIGSSTGYGLASRITATFGYDAATLGVFFEKPATERKTGSAGFYNSAAFHALANKQGAYCKSINGDAFSDEIKQRCIDIINQDLGQVDLVVYSLASPRRTDPKTGITYNSCLKPIGQEVKRKTLDTNKSEVGEVTIEPATDQEISDTIKVMGGEDWELWMDALSEAGVLTDNCKTVAYTYIGREITWPLYGHASIGKAKEDLDRAGQAIHQKLEAKGGEARVAVLKAVVTQASSAIPIMPLYLSLLFKVMKQQNVHEGCIEQIEGLFKDCIYNDSAVLDDSQRWRMDGKELQDHIQEEVTQMWDKVTTENLNDLSDYASYKEEFLKLFGFSMAGVNYDQDVSPLVELPLV